MQRNKIAILFLIVIISVMFIACDKGGGSSGGDAAKTWVGTLDSWDAANGTVNIDGRVYTVADAMKNFTDLAKQGQKYEFTTDEHGNIIKALQQ